MERYERIRKEIIAVEREIAALRHAVKDDTYRESFQKLCMWNEKIRDEFSGLELSRAI